MRPVLVEELRVGWLAPALISLGLVVGGLRLHHAPGIFSQSKSSSLVITSMAVILGLAMGIRRVLRERQAPDFLASRPLSARSVLAAKLTASLADIALLLPGLVVFCGAFFPNDLAFLDFDTGSATAVCLAAGAALVGVSIRWTIASPWISGTACAAFGFFAAYSASHYSHGWHWSRPRFFHGSGSAGLDVCLVVVVLSVAMAFTRGRAR